MTMKQGTYNGQLVRYKRDDIKILPFPDEYLIPRQYGVFQIEIIPARNVRESIINAGGYIAALSQDGNYDQSVGRVIMIEQVKKSIVISYLCKSGNPFIWDDACLVEGVNFASDSVFLQDHALLVLSDYSYQNQVVKITQDFILQAQNRGLRRLQKYLNLRVFYNTLE